MFEREVKVNSILEDFQSALVNAYGSRFIKGLKIELSEQLFEIIKMEFACIAIFHNTEYPLEEGVDMLFRGRYGKVSIKRGQRIDELDVIKSRLSALEEKK